jgi:hypothetical protein
VEGEPRLLGDGVGGEAGGGPKAEDMKVFSPEYMTPVDEWGFRVQHLAGCRTEHHTPLSRTPCNVQMGSNFLGNG